jgi:hypothetical protein
MRHMPPRTLLASLVLYGTFACASAPLPAPEIVPEVRPEQFPKEPPPPPAPEPEPEPAAAEPSSSAVIEPPPFTPASATVSAPRLPPPLPAYDGPEPCRGPAVNGASLVTEACRAGGQPAARARMKEMLRQVRDHGIDFICSDCHPDPTDYARLTDDAVERFAKLMAALPPP